MAGPFDKQYDAIRARIIYYAGLYGIDPNIGIWQLWQENRFRNSGCSSAGACGIAQFMPATAARFGVDRSNIESSLHGWAKYMRWLLDRSYINGDYALALAGYNAGEGNVQKYKGIPPFKETRNYVSTILANAGTVGIAPSSDTSVAPDSSALSTLDGDMWQYAILGVLAVIFFLD